MVGAAEALAGRGYGNLALFGELKAVGPFFRGNLSASLSLLSTAGLT